MISAPALPLRRKTLFAPRPKRALHTAGPVDEILDRLLTRGASALSEAELLAMLIRDGRPKENALETAQDFLAACSGVEGLLTCDREIAFAQQLDPLQTAAVLAAVEMSRRLTRIENGGELLEDPATLADYIYRQVARIGQEVLGAVYLDSQVRFIGMLELFRGTSTKLTIEPSPILREAIRRKAHIIVLFHTHPSGDANPSELDIEFTAKMVKACDLVGLELADHLVVTNTRWVSLRRLQPW